MARVSAYVSRELSERLKQLGVPVSSVCQRALRDAVAKLEAMQRMVDEEAIAAGARRLWRSGDEQQKDAETVDTQQKDAETEGYDSGLRWAIYVAEEPELRTLAELAAGPWVSLRVTWADWPTLFQELIDLDGRPFEHEIIWEREPFIIGFVRGALDGYWAMAAEVTRREDPDIGRLTQRADALSAT
jgi:post-segregation antitoxin (ccd killing protein)